MPIPKQHSGEHDEAFVSRCIGELVGSGEYEQDQAAAICYRQTEMAKMNSKDWRRNLIEPAEKLKQLYKKPL